MVARPCSTSPNASRERGPQVFGWDGLDRELWGLHPAHFFQVCQARWFWLVTSDFSKRCVTLCVYEKNPWPFTKCHLQVSDWCSFGCEVEPPELRSEPFCPKLLPDRLGAVPKLFTAMGAWRVFETGRPIPPLKPPNPPPSPCALGAPNPPNPMGFGPPKLELPPVPTPGPPGSWFSCSRIRSSKRCPPPFIHPLKKFRASEVF